MSQIPASQQSKSYRLWSIALLFSGIWFISRAVESEQLKFWLLGTGLLLCAGFAFRHNLLDISPRALEPRQLGYGWILILILGVVLVLGAAAVSIAG